MAQSNSLKELKESKESTSKSNSYMRLWRAENKDKVKEINRRYYLRNKGYLNRTRSRPWNKSNILKWIVEGNVEKVGQMVRITRPHKDRLINFKDDET